MNLVINGYPSAWILNVIMAQGQSDKLGLKKEFMIYIKVKVISEGIFH